jgi:hypothetical protein
MRQSFRYQAQADRAPEDEKWQRSQKEKLERDAAHKARLAARLFYQYKSLVSTRAYVEERKQTIPLPSNLAIIPAAPPQTHKEATFRRTITRQQLTEKLFGKDMGNNFEILFNSIDIAEDEIRLALRRDKMHAPIIWDTFRLLLPRSFLMKFTRHNYELYSSHVRELIQRAVKGENTTLATKAEIVCMLSEASMNIPLHNSPAYIMISLFKEVLPKAYSKIHDDIEALEFAESYKGASDQLMQEMREKFADKTRNHKPDPERWHKLTTERRQQIWKGA